MSLLVPAVAICVSVSRILVSVVSRLVLVQARRVSESVLVAVIRVWCQRISVSRILIGVDRGAVNIQIQIQIQNSKSKMRLLSIESIGRLPMTVMSSKSVFMK